MARADFIVDLGPRRVEGGEVVASGTLKQILRNKNSVTGLSLVGAAGWLLRLPSTNPPFGQARWQKQKPHRWFSKTYERTI